MKYNCKRCGYSTNIKCNLITHFERKKQCEPNLEDIDIETLKQELEIKIPKNTKIAPKCSFLAPNDSFLAPKDSFLTPNDSSDSTSAQNKYECKYCKKIYSKNSNLHRHMKICKEKQDEVSELKEKLAQKDEVIAQKDQCLKEQMDFMKEQIEILMKKAGNNTTNTDNSINDNSTNNIDNKQIHININGFGKEDLSYLTDRYFRDLFNIPFSAITTLVEEIHFNPKKPQNWNAKIPDDKTSKALIYNAEKEMWVKREKKEVINDMVEKSYNMLDANFEIQKEAKSLDEKGKRKFENFMKIYDKGSKELDKRYETEVREKLMNFREYHRKIGRK